MVLSLRTDGAANGVVIGNFEEVWFELMGVRS